MSRKLPKVILKCKTCGEEFGVQPFRRNKAKFCSKKCVRLNEDALIKGRKAAKEKGIWNKGNNSQIKLECQTCGKEFYVDPWRKDIAKFCSSKCQRHTKETKEQISSTLKNRDYDSYYRKPKIKLICQRCNKDFYVNPARQNAKFCSRHCSDTNNRKRKVIVCQICNKEFYVNVARMDVKFCSKKCRDISYKRQVKVVCQACDKEFILKKSHVKINTRFCSVACRIEVIRGSNSYLWKGGKSFEPYGKEFNNKLKKEIRKRDSFVCQECGKSEQELNRKLDVHHIDFCKTNNVSSNLISLCGSCHVKTLHNREYWIDYYSKKLNMNKDLI